ncbi:MAG TPA: cytochrome C oxidase subunit IV family protein [Candidatus Saccharimonadales bacterium]|nr:cytochrome C oxidase subunit IV family protein [Candidatus Saccharimonadales bacterium]
MNKPEKIVVGSHEEPPVNLATYIIGYVLSLGFTLTAYELVVHRVLSFAWLLTDIIVLAFGQFIVQLVCFLHLGLERKPRWKLLVFGMMISIILIIIIGTIWIMANLNYNMLPRNLNQYMHTNEGL